MFLTLLSTYTVEFSILVEETIRVEPAAGDLLLQIDGVVEQGPKLGRRAGTTWESAAAAHNGDGLIHVGCGRGHCRGFFGVQQNGEVELNIRTFLRTVE